MQVTSSKLTFNVKQDSPFNPSRFLINSQGFTLVELITSIAIIGILAAVGIQQYAQYKIRAYDVHSKQALHDMNLTCKAYWTDFSISDECDLAKAKEYGFVQNTDVVATLPPSALDKFCASAKHNNSPNTYTIDSMGLIYSGMNCKNKTPSVKLTSFQQVSKSFDNNCALLQETAELCSSQNSPITHVDNEGREWKMDCPVTDPRKAKDFYDKLIGDNPMKGENNSNPFYNPDRSTAGWVYPRGGMPYWDEGDYNPHEKLCCHELEDRNLNAPPTSNLGMTRYYKKKFEGRCGIGPKAQPNDNRSFNNRSHWYEGGPTNKSPNIRMLCNVGQEEGHTQFRACDINVRTGESGEEDFGYNLTTNQWINRSACEDQGSNC